MRAFANVVKQRRNHQDHLVKKSIEEREPGLINLPSIPILQPVLSPVESIFSPIVDEDTHQQQTTTTKQNTQTTNPAQTTKTTPGSPQTSPTDPTDPPSSPTSTGDPPTSTSNPSGSGTGSSGQQEPTHSIDVNAGSNPSQFPSEDDVAPSGSVSGSYTIVTTLYSNGVPVGTQTFVGSSQGTNAPNVPGGSPGDPNNGPNGQSSGNSKSPKVSAGVIAALVIVAAIAFLAVFIIARRRRYIAKRSERRLLWWSQAKKERWSGSESLEATAGTQSARSSFATTFDHGSQFHHSSESVAPPLPPMAELRDAHGSGLLLHSQPTSPVQVPPIPALISFDVPAETNDRRNSTFSTRSNGSDEGQYLVAPANSAHPNPSPISVRPFSPSESYSFPRPPSTATPGLTPAANEPADPFMDPVKTVSEPWTPLFFGKEVVKRPFAPTLHDEVAVIVGETVRVSKVFDDGWALIEKIPQEENRDDKGKKKQIMGLIPVDCLREAGQDLSTFLASTRLSSYSAIPEANMGTAM